MIANEESEIVCKQADGLAKILWSKVAPLLAWDDYPCSRPAPVGCGVLVRVGDTVLVLSAAHVFAEFRNRVMWTNLGGELLCLPELRCRFTGSPDLGNHHGDSVDAAVASLPKDYSHDLLSQGLELSNLETETDQDESHYLLLGYPANRTRIEAREVRVKRKALICSEVQNAVYAQVGCDRRTHILFEWRKASPSVTGSLSGSSGCGIWRFDRRTPTNSPKLVATFTGLQRMIGGRKVLVGTRINTHLELLDVCQERVSFTPAA